MPLSLYTFGVFCLLPLWPLLILWRLGRAIGGYIVRARKKKTCQISGPVSAFDAAYDPWSTYRTLWIWAEAAVLVMLFTVAMTLTISFTYDPLVFL